MQNEVDAKGNKSEGFWTKSAGKYFGKAGRGGTNSVAKKSHKKRSRRGRKSSKKR